MAKSTTTKAEMVRRQLCHPVVDADGHLVELLPVLDDEILTYLEEAGGIELADRYRASVGGAVRHRHRAGRAPSPRRSAGTGGPCRRGGLAGARHPRPGHRPPPNCSTSAWTSFGIDFTILYPSTSLACSTWATRARSWRGPWPMRSTVIWPAPSAATATAWPSVR